MIPLSSASQGPVWELLPGLTPYPEAMELMAARVQAIQQGYAPEAIWLLEHPPLLTRGTSGQETDIHAQNPLPVFQSGRGGQITYHGPGQRVVYLMLDLNDRGRDLRQYVKVLESWLQTTLRKLGVTAVPRPGRIGLWVPGPADRDEKIAAIGVRVQKWVTSHGVALNVTPDLSHYQHFVPCGIHDHGVTSLAQLGVPATLADVDQALKETCPFIS